MLNDPQWVRFAGTNAVFGNVEAGCSPTVGVGGYFCNNPDCGKAHITIACIDTEGREISILLAPGTAGDIVKALVEKLGNVGNNFALEAMRALTLLHELATMTEIEADFLDGLNLRDTARSLLSQEPLVVGQILPRRYSEDDRLRAAEMMRAKRRDHPALPYRNLAEDLEMVDIVAEALGLRLGGA